MRVIIPCAGFGTRMNMAPDQSKEMLVDPGCSRGLPILNWSLELCEKYGLDPLIITRKEKTDLIEYTSQRGVDTQLITPYGEWPNTILMSENLWAAHNIMILPDTRFKPKGTVQLVINDLENGAAASIALHSVTDSSKWCIVKDYDLIEKPTFNENAWAMGLIGFTKNEGYRLFKGLRTRGAPYRLLDASFQYLNSFVDITRTGVVETS